MLPLLLLLALLLLPLLLLLGSLLLPLLLLPLLWLLALLLLPLLLLLGSLLSLRLLWSPRRLCLRLSRCPGRAQMPGPRLLLRFPYAIPSGLGCGIPYGLGRGLRGGAAGGDELVRPVDQAPGRPGGLVGVRAAPGSALRWCLVGHGRAEGGQRPR
ncbi:hypothetical protein [Microtetraspora sp. NBRC 16547]|uniref:hypothetical protein n=1 Tax=Microtetraspora sp. NBRC 16547 TaxID=3030993 RepID=UPI0024A5DED8|nr:hypothetical protein [Microtetraspora sp. NBRC 16547]GLW97747.1 hypothetical protein Misp02_18340 [Microtetraspora sp. NBRC 16547]